ncbi:4-coumarate--CoA ligase 1 [Diprion similis]|uniref:4-coumarate--CoA ligase 1 n=1 Tax=Diprion similis TaxID=362088 RepID=UPI001EF91ABB|nr:4-coumarate--CoA ligase 1 [Diprion similis]
MSKNNGKVISSIIPRTPTPRMSLGQYMLNCLRNNGTSVAQVDAVTGEILRYNEILEQSIRLCESLRKQGLKSGDHVSIISENRLNLVIPTLASLYLGAAIVPLNPTYSKAELLHALNISKPSIIFVSPRSEKLMLEIVGEMNPKPLVIQLSSDADSSAIPTLSDILEETEPLSDLNSFRAVEFQDYKKHAAVILCSSGTTGLPKGVMLSHHNILTLVQHFRNPDFVDLNPDRPLLGLLPYFHGYGFSLVLGLIATRGKAIVMSEFDPLVFLSAIQTHKVAIVPLVPPIMVFLAKHPVVAKFDLSSIQEIICGAAPLSEEIQTAVMQRLGVPCIRQGYGMTETTVIVSLSPSTKNKAGSVGIVSPDTLCKVVDVETSKALGPHEQGEICIAGDLVMMGYCGDPKTTAEIIDQDGWLHTGDIGYYDEDGYIFVVDRLKELIKYKAFQVPPAELEAILLKHPAVKDAAVIGIPDENSGELPLAFVARQPGAQVSADEIRKFVDGQVSPSKWLRGGVRFIDEIPKSPSGKILRRELRKLISKL